MRLSDASVLSEARIGDGVRAVTMLWRAFDKTVRRKPLAFAATRSMGIQSIWSWKSLQRRELCEKLGY